MIQKAGKKSRGLGPSRIEAIQNAMARAFKVDLLKGISTFKRHISVEELARAIQSGNFSDVIGVMQKSDFASTMRPYVQGAVSAALDRVSNHAIEVLPSPVKAELRFDIANPALKAYIENHVGSLITTSEAGMLEMVRGSVADAFQRGLGHHEVAANIKESIGLNAPQARAVENFRQGLIASDVAPGRIEARVATKIEEFKQARALMIARTETNNATSYGELAVWTQATEQDLLPPNATKTWLIDATACEEWCQSMDGESVGLDESWRVENQTTRQVKYVDVPSAIHPCCYCISDLSF